MKVEIFHKPLTIVMVHDFFSCEERLFLIPFVVSKVSLS